MKTSFWSLEASLSAMAKAVRGLSASAMESLVVLVDGCNRPPELLAAGEKWTRLSQRDREALKNQTKLSRWFAQKQKQDKEEPWRPKDVEAVVEGDGRVPSCLGCVKGERQLLNASRAP